MKTVNHKVDFCVVGGGLSGMCAAVAAARHGKSVVLIQDRPVVGGNASSEVRMHVCGAHGANNRETGIIEEIKLENRYHNPLGSFSIWDSVLYEKVRFEPNITLLLNCSVYDATVEKSNSVYDATMDKSGGGYASTADTRHITSVTGWQLTTYIKHTVEATLFADCSGDSILADLSGAEYRTGRESSNEFDEPIAPESEDARTMGNSCLIQARETRYPQQFIPPKWAYDYETDDDLPVREHEAKGRQNFWWVEVGGMQDCLHDAEELRDELLKIAFGVWDHVKNHGDHGAENWTLDWVGFLPGKRESRRYVGDHVLCQKDIESEGHHFDDIVAYGGWTMDDHFPEGFYHREAGTIWHPAPSPYGIPYRSLYSKNIDNLFFAGRNISATHVALSSTRVMATCAVMGQAVGTAAAIAATSGLTPREVYHKKIEELQQTVTEDDCYLPFHKRTISPLTLEAELRTSEAADKQEKTSDCGEVSTNIPPKTPPCEVLRNGHDRPIGAADNGYYCICGEWVEYAFEGPRFVASVRLVFDSDLREETDGRMPQHYHLPEGEYTRRVAPIPPSMTKDFRIEVTDSRGRRQTIVEKRDNYQRLYRKPIEKEVLSVRFIPLSTWAESEHAFAALPRGGPQGENALDRGGPQVETQAENTTEQKAVRTERSHIFAFDLF